MRQIKQVRITRSEFLRYCLVRLGVYGDVMPSDIEEFSIGVADRRLLGSEECLSVLLASDKFPVEGPDAL
jgi:hypothetical protein